jgi:hypothetical protein
VLGQDGGEFMTTPLRRVGAGLEGIVVDETLEVVFQGSGDFARATRARAIPQTQGTVLRKALHPSAQGGIGKTEGGRDGVDMMPSDDLTHGLRATKDAGLFRLWENCL